MGCGGVFRDVTCEANRAIHRYVRDLPTWRFDLGIARYSTFERLTEQKGLREGLRFLSSRDRALNAAQLEISASETSSTYWHRSAKETEVQM